MSNLNFSHKFCYKFLPKYFLYTSGCITYFLLSWRISLRIWSKLAPCFKYFLFRNRKSLFIFLFFQAFLSLFHFLSHFSGRQRFIRSLKDALSCFSLESILFMLVVQELNRFNNIDDLIIDFYLIFFEIILFFV